MIGDLIGEWIKGILIDGIMGNLSGLFNTVNTKVGEIASDVGSTPQDWNGGIFSMLQNLSETVIVPIAAAILALVMCYELIDMIVEKNNMHDFDSSMFFRWIFKSAFAILIVTNTWNIVMGVFDATQQVVNQSAGVIIGDTSIDFDTLLPDLESRLEAMDIGPLLGLWFQTLVVGLTMNILSICIFLVTYAQKQMDEVLSKGWTVQEIRQFFIDEYGIVGFQSVWNMSAYKKADAGEVQQYLDSVFQEESYTSYLGRKYADYLGITSILFTISVFAILLMRDMRKSIYSFIHTKPISSRNYVLGKYIAGISMVLLFVVILTAIVDVVAVSAGNSYGYKTSLWDIWANIIMYDLPGILLTGCIMLFISILFKNVIPAIPAMLLYFIYANIGTLSSAEDYHYQVKPGAIFIRFPQLFTETEIPSGIVSNQIFLLILAIVLLIASIQIWERRRDT